MGVICWSMVIPQKKMIHLPWQTLIANIVSVEGVKDSKRIDFSAPF